MSSSLIATQTIENKILTIREQQVMVDYDLAMLYGVETKVLNQAVRRNIERFPNHFRFQLTKGELKEVVTNCDHLKMLKFTPVLPYVFTEQGIAMLSTVLRSETAVSVSIRIMDAFVAMRKFLFSNAQLFQRIRLMETRQIETEQKQLITEKRVDEILEKIGKSELQPKQGIFYDGQIFDAFLFVSKLLKTAKESIILVDNYVDENTLQLFSVCRSGIKIAIYTKKISANMNLAIMKFSEQYNPIAVTSFTQSHDRFLIIDDVVYHFGASLKDLGKKWFAFSKMELPRTEIISRLPSPS